MRIFITGASGFVGSAVVRELITGGHEVVGLVRSEAAATSVTRAGATAYRGDLADPASLARGAAESDAVIHTGFVHDYANFKASCELDQTVIDVLGSALSGSQRPLLITSALGILPTGAVATEQTQPLDPSPNPRAASEAAARAQLQRGVNVSVLRLPPSTHGEGDHGFVPMLISMARAKQAAAYVGDGANLWPAVHRLDAARLYRLAIERAVAGSTYHAVAEEGVPFREITEVIGRRLNVPVVSKTRDEAAAHFGTFAHFAQMNVVASSAQTRAMLDWRPTEVGLIGDLARAAYFE